MDLKEFVKWGVQTKVVPVLLSADQIVYIYRSAQKMNPEEHLISYQTFKSSLIRVCIIGNDKLAKTEKFQNSRVKELFHKKDVQ
jgi:hypothetical protein